VSIDPFGGKGMGKGLVNRHVLHGSALYWRGMRRTGMRLTEANRRGQRRRARA
jgi:hypothetical protein